MPDGTEELPDGQAVVSADSWQLYVQRSIPSAVTLQSLSNVANAGRACTLQRHVESAQMDPQLVQGHPINNLIKMSHKNIRLTILEKIKI
jgi:hypothetical protein